MPRRPLVGFDTSYRSHYAFRMQRRYHGIDFSGGAAAWKPACRRPSVWIATVESDAGGLELSDLMPVQDLAGPDSPFERLVSLLSKGDFEAAGIDAPFSIPTGHLPIGGHVELLQRMRQTAYAPDRPFPRGAALVDVAASNAPLTSAKPLRATEQFWKASGVHARSTLWNGPRGGAPFAVACLSLLAKAKRPIWPWSTGKGMLVEAYPAAQLAVWGLPHQGYNKPEQGAARAIIAGAVSKRVRVGEDRMALLHKNADALDAVIAAFGAVAAATDAYVRHDTPGGEGRISVMTTVPATAPHG